MCSFETHVFKSSMNPKETSFFSLCFGSIIWKQRFTTISAAFDFLDVDGTRKIRRNQFEPFLRPDLFSLLIPVSSRILLSPVWFWRRHHFGFQWCIYSLETWWSSMGKWLFQLDDSTLLHRKWLFLFARKKHGIIRYYPWGFKKRGFFSWISVSF